MAGAVISDGLIGYWPLNEGSGTTAADVINSNSGTLSGGVSFVASEKSGLPGYAISLTGGSGEGGDHVKISSGWDAQQIPSELMPTSAVSVSAWANYSTGTYGAVFQNFFFTGGTRSGYGIYGRSGSNGFRWFIPTAGVTGDEGSNFLTYLGTSPNTWYHVVGTYDGATGTAVLYINGQAEVTCTSLGSTIDWDPTPYNCLIGRYDDDNESYGFQGKIDDVAVWNRALTPAEVTYLYNSGDGNPPTTAVSVSVTINPTSLEVTEGQVPDSYEIVLDTQPSADVLITATPGDTEINIGTGAGTVKILTFTSINWDTAQTVIVTAVDDDEYEGDDNPHTSVITHTAQGDVNYSNIAISSVSVEVFDNELNCGDWGYKPEDFNQDCYVDLFDFALFANQWLQPIDE